LSKDQTMILVSRGTANRKAALGFTLVELLVVIAIIGILVALLLPAIQAAREAARRAQCANNMKQIGLAMINYVDTKGVFPASAAWPAPPGSFGASIKGGTWAVEILPFIEQQVLYDRYDMTKSVTGSTGDAINHQLYGTPMPWYVCPSDGDAPTGGVFEAGVKADGSGWVNHTGVPQMGLWYVASSGPTHFDRCHFCAAGSTTPSRCCQGRAFGTDPTIAGDPQGQGVQPSFAGLFGRWSKPIIRFKDISDGLTNVIMVGEQINGHCRYTCVHCSNFPISATNIPINTMLRHKEGAISANQPVVLDGDDPEVGGYAQSCGYKSRHPGGAHMLMADGSVHFFREDIDFDLYNILGARASGEPKQVP
jgi:prepilin-type N-terminal cleavage/methylation domain-containing protein/prepilin-type processing-associated H-X9-DG protein